MPRRLGIGRRLRGGGPGAPWRGQPAGLRDDAVQHLQDALQFLALDRAGGAVAAVAAQFEAECILFTRDRQPVGELGAGRARFEISGGVCDIAGAVLAIAASRSNAIASPRSSAGARCARFDVLAM